MNIAKHTVFSRLEEIYIKVVLILIVSSGFVWHVATSIFGDIWYYDILNSLFEINYNNVFFIAVYILFFIVKHL